MSLMEEYNPLKGKMFQILKPDGTLQPGASPPIDDQETLKLYRKMLFTRLADQRCLSASATGAIRDVRSHLGTGGMPNRKCLSA